MRRRKQKARRGAAAVELAILSPMLVLLFVLAVDFSRVFYFSQLITDCAKNGALYGSNLTTARSPYASLNAAALADAPNLSPQPTVSSSTGNDAAGNPYIQVTVSWPFHPITGLPGVPSTVNLSRTVRMRVAPN